MEMLTLCKSMTDLFDYFNETLDDEHSYHKQYKDLFFAFGDDYLRIEKSLLGIGAIEEKEKVYIITNKGILMIKYWKKIKEMLKNLSDEYFEMDFLERYNQSDDPFQKQRSLLLTV